jgi:hypothetical protein
MDDNNVSLTIDDDLISQASAVLGEIGMDVETAIKDYLQKIVKKEVKLSKSKKDRIPCSELYGIYEGKIWISDDFDAPLEDLKDYM